jgi:NitT/TauT family transport system substrate-binding protein
MDPDDLEANFIHNRLQAVLTLNQGNKFYEKADGVIAISTVGFYEPHGLTIFREGGKIPIPDEDIKKIMRGCVEAIEWMRDPANWEEYKAFLKEYSLPPDSPELSDEEFRTLTQGYQYFEPQTLLKHNQKILRDHFEKYRNFLISHESLGKNVLDAFTYDKVIYNQALIEVLQEYGQ